jgi:hypothetical protein
MIDYAFCIELLLANKLNSPSLTFFAITAQLEQLANALYGELVDWDEFTKNELANNGKVLFENMDKMLGVAKATKSVADDIKEYTRYPDFTPGVKFAGCDGVDQDTEEDDPNGFGPRRYKVVDECEEDNYPPELVLLERLPVVNVDNDVDVFRLERSFSKKEEAISYLESATQVIDDCSRPELLTRKVELVRLACSDSEFKVTPIQEQCADSGNLLEGTPMSFLLDVDEDVPVVSCGFRNTVPEGKAQRTRWVDGNDGKNLFLRLEGGSNWNPVDAGLFYEVTVRSLNVSWIRSRKLLWATVLTSFVLASFRGPA